MAIAIGKTDVYDSRTSSELFQEEGMERPFENLQVDVDTAGLRNTCNQLSMPDLGKADKKKGTVPGVYPAAFGKTTAVKDENPSILTEDCRPEEMGVPKCNSFEMKADHHQSDDHDRKHMDSDNDLLPELKEKENKDEEPTEQQNKQRKKRRNAKGHVRTSSKRYVGRDSGDTLAKRKVDMPSGIDEVKDSGRKPPMMPVQSFGKQHSHLKQRSAGDAKRTVVVHRKNLTKADRKRNDCSSYYIPMEILRCLQNFAKNLLFFFCKFPMVFDVLFMLTHMPFADSCTPTQSDHQVVVGGNHTVCLQLTSGYDYTVNVDNSSIGACNLFIGLGQGFVEDKYKNSYQVSVNNTDCCVTLNKVSCGNKSICANATRGNNSVCCSLPVQCYPHDGNDNNVPVQVNNHANNVWVPVVGFFAVVIVVALLISWICKNKCKKMYTQLRESIFYQKV